MKIVADENIPLLAEAFGPLGEVLARPADRITPEAVADADALIVRSVTKVGADLLDASAVRFVATATIGVDHVDQAYLQARGIGFASAAGSNARSVAEYVFAALVTLAAWRDEALAGKTLGIVGMGHIGSRVARIGEALGMRILRNDPPLERETGDPIYVPIEALAEADAVTFHVPLTRDGPHATYHMIDETLLRGLKCGVTLINSSRGAVGETEALRAAARARHLGALVLDVWEGEPEIDLDLLAATTLATPHIAGYSYDGKVNGTRQVMEALCAHFGIERAWDPAPLMPPARIGEIEIAAPAPPVEAVRQAVASSYDITADDERLRTVQHEPLAERGPYFQSLRKHYPVRREFRHTRVRLAEADPAVTSALAALGFPVVDAGSIPP